MARLRGAVGTEARENSTNLDVWLDVGWSKSRVDLEVGGWGLVVVSDRIVLNTRNLK